MHILYASQVSAFVKINCQQTGEIMFQQTSFSKKDAFW